MATLLQYGWNVVKPAWGVILWEITLCMEKKTGVLKPFVVCKIYSTDHLSTDFKKMI